MTAKKRKKKILFHSDFALVNTGFAKNTRNILSYLYKTGKYEIVNLACHAQENSVDLTRTPWKSVGSVPNQNEVNAYLSKFKPEQQPYEARNIHYGSIAIDRVVNSFKPDVYFGVQDIWGVEYAIDKNWFSKITSVIWTTLDSLPLLDSAIAAAPKVKHYWMWSDFATQEMHRLGHKHVKTVHGAVEAKNFYPLSAEEKESLRKRFNLSGCFVSGFVFRNQLRKQVIQLIEGFKFLRDKYPTQKHKLFLHTYWPESQGWDIKKYINYYKLDNNDVVTTYVCRACKDYNITNYVGEDIDCPHCKAQKSCVTSNINIGVDEKQLNEIYNILDLYVHPISSGGLELPIVEAKLAGVPTAVTNYSCGEEMCCKEANSFVLEYEKYYEPQTNFIKSTTYPHSIEKAIFQAYTMDKEELVEMGLNGRKWVLEGFETSIIGKILEDLIDNAPYIENFDELVKPIKADIRANVDDIFSAPKEMFVDELYRRVLKREPDEGGRQHWLKTLGDGFDPNLRQNVIQFFKKTAADENAKNGIPDNEVKFDDLLDKDDAGKRILYVMPEGIGDVFLSSSLFSSLKAQYPDHNLYVATKPEFQCVLHGNPYIHKILPYVPQMDSLLWSEGQANHMGFFEIAFLPFVTTQRFLTYLHNGKTKIAYKDLCI